MKALIMMAIVGLLTACGGSSGGSSGEQPKGSNLSDSSSSGDPSNEQQSSSGDNTVSVPAGVQGQYTLTYSGAGKVGLFSGTTYTVIIASDNSLSIGSIVMKNPKREDLFGTGNTVITWRYSDSGFAYVLNTLSDGSLDKITVYQVSPISPPYLIGSLTAKDNDGNNGDGSASFSGPQGLKELSFGDNGILYPLNQEVGDLVAGLALPSSKTILIMTYDSIYSFSETGEINMAYGDNGAVAVTKNQYGNWVFQESGQEYFIGKPSAFDETGRSIWIRSTYGGFELTRLGADGWLDPDFSPDGPIAFNYYYLFDNTTMKNPAVKATAGTADGSVFIAGQVDSPRRWFIFKITSQGQQDMTFNGNSGIWMSDDALSLGDLGKLYVGGDGYLYVLGQNDSSNTLVTRVDLATGRQDVSYGVNGFVTLTTPEAIESIKLDNDGKLLAVGNVALSDWTGKSAFYITRLNADGNADTSFGDNGEVTVNFYDKNNTGVRYNYALDILLQSDGGMIVTGYLYNSNSSEPQWMIMTRLDQSGSLTEGFGMNDRLLAFRHTDAYQLRGRNLMLMTSDGKILGVAITDEMPSKPKRLTFACWK